MSGDLREVVSLEVQAPIEGVFVLDRSALDGPDRLAVDEVVGLEWVPVLCQATSVTVVRGGSRQAVGVTVSVGTISARFRDAMDPTTDARWRPGVGVRLVVRGQALTSGEDTAVYTGTTADFALTYDKASLTVFVTVAGTDAVQVLANTMRYGAANPVVEYEPWNRRAERVLQSSPVPFVPPVIDQNPVPVIDASAGAAEAAEWTGGAGWTLSERDGEVVMAPVAWSYTARRHVSGLVPGRLYLVTLRAYWLNGETGRFGVEGIGTTDVTGVGALYDHGFEFVAESAEHEVILAITGAATPEVAHVRVAADPTRAGFNARNVVYESNLANHLDLATQTGASGWFVDRSGVIRFRQDGTEVVAHFSDVHDATDPLHVCYTAADVAYDTAAVVNELTLRNHGRKYDAEQGWIADDVASTYTDLASQATWGTRAAGVDTAIYSPAEGLYSDAARVLAGVLMGPRTAPHLTISRVTFDAAEHRDLAADLDIYARVIASCRGVSGLHRVVGIRHDLTVTGWTVTVDLIEE